MLKQNSIIYTSVCGDIYDYDYLDCQIGAFLLGISTLLDGENSNNTITLLDLTSFLWWCAGVIHVNVPGSIIVLLLCCC